MMLFETGEAAILGALIEGSELQVWADDDVHLGTVVVSWSIDDLVAENEEDIVVERPMGYDRYDSALYGRFVRDGEDLADFELPVPGLIEQYTITWEMGQLNVDLTMLGIG